VYRGGVVNACSNCGKVWAHGDCTTTVSRRARCQSAVPVKPVDNRDLYPRRYDEVKRALYGTPTPMPGQMEMFA
jgi:hypothetical protein